LREPDYFSLQPTEAAIAHMASRIFSSFIAAGKVTEQNENELMDRSIALAMSMARKVDNLIDSDSESGEEKGDMATL